MNIAIDVNERRCAASGCSARRLGHNAYRRFGHGHHHGVEVVVVGIVVSQSRLSPASRCPDFPPSRSGYDSEGWYNGWVGGTSDGEVRHGIGARRHRRPGRTAVVEDFHGVL